MGLNVTDFFFLFCFFPSSVSVFFILLGFCLGFSWIFSWVAWVFAWVFSLVAWVFAWVVWDFARFLLRFLWFFAFLLGVVPESFLCVFLCLGVVSA